MKVLHLIRHAKSSWEDPSLSDKERPLNSRGKNACKFMAEPILRAGCSFEHVFCSTAVRAQKTIGGIARALPEEKITWTDEDALYTFNADTLLSWLQTLNHTLDEVVIVGHNPALTDLSNMLSDDFIENMPTCGYVKLLADIASWSELDHQCARLELFLRPKLVKQSLDG